jgi:diacylglycerol O-acyltransferase / wax synthase
VAPEMRFEHRMSDADALMWKVEKDPLLRSTITVVWILDRAPDRARFTDKVERATRLIPRLRQRVVSNPLSIAPPRFEVDPFFDCAFHVRWIRAPGEGSLRDLLDLAQPMAMQGFDRARPLWEMAVVEGLENGRAGMIMKLHHSLSDGVGLVQMTTSLIERARERDPSRPPKPMPPVPEVHVMSQWERVLDALGHERRRLFGRARRTAASVARIAGDPLGTARAAVDASGSVARMLRPVTEPHSPVMRGRSLSLRFDSLSVSLERLKAAARRIDGRLNDAFVAGILGGMRRYHEEHGESVDTLRMTMPINVREAGSETVAGNQFAPARFAVPLGIADPVERMRAVQDLVREQRNEPALPLVQEVSALLNRLPTAISTAMFGTMLKGIDFVTSNVPGPPFEVYVSGARVEEIYGFGPLAGAAANVTLFSYKGDLGIAVNTDPAAVRDPERFIECLRSGMEEVARVGDAKAHGAAARSPS